MASRVSTMAPWIGAAAALLAVTSMAASHRVRYGLGAVAGRAADGLAGPLRGLQSSMQGGTGRQMAALREMSHTADSATTQWESSMTVSKVAAALAAEPGLRGCNVAVRVIGGILHLEGEVRNERARTLAAQIVKRASGAQMIANDLRIAPPVG